MIQHIFFFFLREFYRNPLDDVLTNGFRLVNIIFFSHVTCVINRQEINGPHKQTNYIIYIYIPTSYDENKLYCLQGLDHDYFNPSLLVTTIDVRITLLQSNVALQ